MLINRHNSQVEWVSDGLLGLPNNQPTIDCVISVGSLDDDTIQETF